MSSGTKIDVGEGYRLVLPTEELLSEDQAHDTGATNSYGARTWTGGWWRPGANGGVVPSLRDHGASVPVERVCRRKLP